MSTADKGSAVGSRLRRDPLGRVSVAVDTPGVPLPAGAEPDLWQNKDSSTPHRDVYSEIRCVLNSTGDPLRSPVVQAAAVQWADGSIDVDGHIRPPLVLLEAPPEPGLTSAQARELAALIIAAADLADEWASQ